MPIVIGFAGFLAVDGGFSEPLYRPSSLLTGKFTGNFANLAE
jgi:hypothetical protein